jgi:hypothetical protein
MYALMKANNKLKPTLEVQQKLERTAHLNGGGCVCNIKYNSKICTHSHRAAFCEVAEIRESLFVQNITPDSGMKRPAFPRNVLSSPRDF